MRFLSALILALASFATTAFAQSSELEIVLDCSGSMMSPVDGRARITVAKETLLALLEKIPEGTRVGFRAYAHRYPVGQEESSRAKSCQDTELLVPIGPIQKQAIREKVTALKCVGMTPIAYSLEVAAGDFSKGDLERTIILLSDGKETCDGDSVALLKKLKAMGFKVVVHVIGFAVDASTAQELNQIAVAGGGKYYDAKKAEQLAEGLQDAVQQAIPAFRAKEQFHFFNWVEAMGVEVLGEKDGRLSVRDARGNLLDVPLHTCVVPRKMDPTQIQVGTEVLATTQTINGKPSALGAGKVVESKDNKFRVTLYANARDLWVPAELVFEMHTLDEQGEAVPLAVHKAPAGQRGKGPEQLLQPGTAGEPFSNLDRDYPYGITMKVAGEPREIQRIGFLMRDVGESVAAAEIYAGAATDSGFVWHPVGLVELDRAMYWQFFTFPPVKTQYLHLRILRSHGQGLRWHRLRVYEQAGTLGAPVKPIADPQPPVGEAGELEKRAAEILFDEGSGRYRRVKLLKKKGDEVLGLTGDGRKVTVSAAQSFPLEPLDLATAELGDDVLVNDQATGGAEADVYVTAVLTESSKTEVKFQLGAKEFKAKPDQLFKAPKK